jgi:hypothetical protein
MRYIKVFFQKITSRSSDDYWYAYTNRPSFSAAVALNGTAASFNVSIRDRNATTTTQVGQDITMWLSDISDEEAFLYRDTYGATAYLRVDGDNEFKLVSSDDFQALDTSEQSNLVASLQLQA